MGMLWAKMWHLWSYDEFKIIIVGLNNAGKTTTLYKLLFNEVVATAPTIGSNVEEFVYKNIKFVMWDIGGQEAVRASWSTYYVNTHAVILVADSTDRKNIQTVRDELDKMLVHENLRSAKILVFANKQDLKGAMSASELSEAIGLHEIKDHDWHIQSCCALTGEGLFQGMDWIAQRCK
eukprot:TRINITY_DN2571_c0_g1_i1.p1 TRINITY_DN2571_c0_g1~~TRINITY_DN2571_c0_g1_i1.p1  ORF type:complete len:178 (+),score=27.93 TRINITY_DN2571_c0_g1_i1:117-650(+)